MPPPVQPRLPFGPVVFEVGAENQCDAARRLGIPLRRVHRYAHEGVPLLSCDELARLAGVHPLELWGNAWNDAWDRWDAACESSRLAAAARRAAAQHRRYVETATGARRREHERLADRSARAREIERRRAS